MKYIEFKVCGTRQGLEMVTQVLLRRGIEQVSIDDPADLQDIMDKEHEYDWDYVDESLRNRLEGEAVLHAYLEDSEESKKLVQELKIDMMKLKADEQYFTYGKDADFGRLYAEANLVDDIDWKDK